VRARFGRLKLKLDVLAVCLHSKHDNSLGVNEGILA